MLLIGDPQFERERVPKAAELRRVSQSFHSTFAVLISIERLMTLSIDVGA